MQPDFFHPLIGLLLVCLLLSWQWRTEANAHSLVAQPPLSLFESWPLFLLFLSFFLSFSFSDSLASNESNYVGNGYQNERADGNVGLKYFFRTSFLTQASICHLGCISNWAWTIRDDKVTCHIGQSCTHQTISSRVFHRFYLRAIWHTMASNRSSNCQRGAERNWSAHLDSPKCRKFGSECQGLINKTNIEQRRGDDALFANTPLVSTMGWPSLFIDTYVQWSFETTP